MSRDVSSIAKETHEKVGGVFYNYSNQPFSSF